VGQNKEFLMYFNEILFWWYSNFIYRCATNGLFLRTAVTISGKKLQLPEILTL